MDKKGKNNTFVDSLIEYAKYTLPRLTNLFGSVLEGVKNITIVDGIITVETNNLHRLNDGDKIYIQGVKIPLKISDIEYDNAEHNILFKTSWLHHLLVRLTKQVDILSTEENGFAGTFKLLMDYDEDHLVIETQTEPQNTNNSYLIRYHNQIINGYRTIKVIDHTHFQIADYKLDNLTVDLSILKECLEYATILVGCRIYKCFDLQDAINFFNNIFQSQLNPIIDNDTDEWSVKDENTLTAFIEPPLNSINKNNGTDCAGRQIFELNMYIFVPLKINSLEGAMANVSDNIIRTVDDVFNRIFGNKTFEFNTGMTQKKTSLFLFKNSGKAINRNNVLYIHKITYEFSLTLYDDDFDLKEDYFRLNRLIFNSMEKTVDIKF